MPTSIVAALSAIGNAVANFFGFAKQKDAQMNAPAMQDNAQAQEDQAEAAKIEHDITAAHAGKPQALEDDEA